MHTGPPGPVCLFLSQKTGWVNHIPGILGGPVLHQIMEQSFGLNDHHLLAPPAPQDPPELPDPPAPQEP